MAAVTLSCTFPAGDTEAPASTRVEQNACCARVHYSPSLQQQSSVSSKGVHADFIIQYDVALRDLMGEVQVRTSLFHISRKNECKGELPNSHLGFWSALRCTMDILSIILHQKGSLWYPKTSYLSLMSAAQ